jgi:hypothetical protein
MIAQMMALVLIAGRSPDAQSWRNMDHKVMEVMKPSINTTWRYVEIYQQ